MDADAQQFFDAVLCRLGFEFFCCTDKGQQGNVQVEHIRASNVLTHLANGFQKWLTLDITNGTANLHDHHIGVGTPGNGMHSLLDFIGDMGNNLNGTAQVFTAALFTNDRGINLARSDIVGLVGWLIGKAFVVTQIQVGLRAVVGHKNLAMLIRRHRTGININVGVQFHNRDRYPTVFQ